MSGLQSYGNLGYQSYTHNVLQAPYGQSSNFGSTFNNGLTSTTFNVQSFLPGSGPFQTNQKAQQFASPQFLPVLAGMGQAQAIDLPNVGLGQFLFNPNFFQFPPSFLQSWGNYFQSPLNGWFPPAYAT